MTLNHKIFLRYLHERYEAVAKYREDCGTAADEVLKTLDYGDNKQEQDYDNAHIQDLYAVRYMYAYGYEYREMFRRLFRTQELPSKSGILSIGCGNGIDFWAAVEARDLELTPQGKGLTIQYTGLDLANWQNLWGKDFPNKYTFKRANADYLMNTGIDEFLKAHPVLPYNIIVFPKVISELPDSVFEDMCTAFQNATFQGQTWSGHMFNIKKVYFFISLRRDISVSMDDCAPLDKMRSDRLIEAMEENDFVVEDREAAEIVAGDDQKIVECDPDFFYPTDINDGMRELANAGISNLPMKSASYVCNRIIIFLCNA